jgi:Protein of unknown function (DUF2911)
MRRFAVILAAAVLTLALSATAYAQKTTQIHPGKGGSPHVKTEWTIDGAKLAIEYGRPSLKGRPEAEVMPPGKPWRTGADEATTLTTDKPLKIGTVDLKPGTYTLNTEPGKKDWKLLVGKLEKPGQWGVPYKADLETGKAPMKLGKTKSPVEQLTISVDDSKEGGTLRIEWGKTSATVPIKVADAAK